jgi:uncharacterized membrane protein required for colicin V production
MKDKILLIIWALLALSSFVSSFFAPLVVKIIGLTFGGVNIIIILTWVFSLLYKYIDEARLQAFLEEANKSIDEELGE